MLANILNRQGYDEPRAVRLRVFYPYLTAMIFTISRVTAKPSPVPEGNLAAVSPR